MSFKISTLGIQALSAALLAMLLSFGSVANDQLPGTSTIKMAANAKPGCLRTYLSDFAQCVSSSRACKRKARTEKNKKKRRLNLKRCKKLAHSCRVNASLKRKRCKLAAKKQKG